MYKKFLTKIRKYVSKKLVLFLIMYRLNDINLPQLNASSVILRSTNYLMSARYFTAWHFKFSIISFINLINKTA